MAYKNHNERSKTNEPTSLRNLRPSWQHSSLGYKTRRILPRLMAILFRFVFCFFVFI